MPDQPAEQEKPSGRRKQLIASAVTLVTLAVVFFGVLPQFADYSEAWDAIAGMSDTAIVVLVLVTIANIIVYVWPYQAVLEGMRFGPAFAIRQTSFAISNGVPAGGAFGLGVQYAMITDYGYGPDAAAAAIAITGVWNSLITLGLPVFAILGLAMAGESVEEWAMVASVVGLVLVLAAVVILILVFRSEATAAAIGRFLDRVVGRLTTMVRHPIDADLVTKIVDFRSSTVEVVRARVWAITSTNLLQQLMQYTVLLVAFKAVAAGSGEELTALEVFAAFAIGRLGTFIPLTPGGLGTVDAVMVATMVAFGADQDTALAATLVWRAATYFPQLFIGIGTFLVWRRRKAREAARASAS